MKKLIIFFMTVLFIFTSALCVSAADTAPTDSFMHWTLSDGSTKTVVTRPLYEAVKKIDARSLGLEEEFGVIVQIKCDEKGNTYILTENSEIIMLDSDYNFVRKCEIVDSNNEIIGFDGADGFYIVSENEIYIADTTNARVLHCINDIVVDEILIPESALIPSDFVFQPTKIAKDSKGYTYVLSEGSYYGIVLYDPNGEFNGFYGANTVKGTILTTLEHIWDTLTQNDIKRAKKIKKLPYQIIDICIDNKDFVYTCTGKNAGGAVGQIRMLSPGGTNILTGAEDKNFGEIDKVKRRKQIITQNFTSIATDSKGFIYSLDSAYGFIYVYDTKSNLLGAFAGGIGNGNQLGVFSSSNSLSLNGTEILVSDSIDNSITIFERTEYGNKVFAAQEITLNSDYIGAKPLWEEVYSEDSYNRLAILGLGKAAYDEGEYSLSMKYAKLANDKETYSLALKQKQNAFISKHWTLIFISAVLLIGLFIALIIISIKKKMVLIKNEKVRILFSAMIHPFDSFNTIKYKKKGSIVIAFVLIVLYFITSVIAVMTSDFRYTSFDPSTYNSVMQLVRTVGIIVLWTVCNWAVSTLMHGRGKIKEVFVVTAYSTLPLIIYNIVSIPLSHLLSSSNSTLISGLNIAALILTGIMLCVGHMIIHDYSFPRVLFTAVLTIILMILVVFVIFMIGILLSQFWSFFTSIFLELVRL